MFPDCDNRNETCTAILGACTALRNDAQPVFFIFVPERKFFGRLFHFWKIYSKIRKLFENKNLIFWNLKIRRFTDRVFWVFWGPKKLSFWKKANKNTEAPLLTHTTIGCCYRDGAMCYSHELTNFEVELVFVGAILVAVLLGVSHPPCNSGCIVENWDCNASEQHELEVMR